MRKRFYLAAFAAPALVVLLAASPPSQSASAGPQCSGTLLTSVSSSVLPQGSTAYKYHLPDGTSFVNIAPPAGFNVMTASNALLAEVGLPPRPTSATDLQSWEEQVAPFSKSAVNGTEKFCTNDTADMPTPSEPTGGVAPAGSIGHNPSYNWSGYEDEDGRYEKAVGHFQQAYTPTGDTNAAMSNWVGLNGVGAGGRLVQAGTINQYTSPAVGTEFWENYCVSVPNNGCNYTQAIGPTTYRGDDISVSVSWNPQTNISYYAVADNGVEGLNVQYTDWPGSHSGDAAEFITESYPGRYVPDFVTEQFSSARTYTLWNGDSYVWLANQDYESYVMTDDGSWHNPPCSNSAEIRVYPNNISGGSYQNQWCSQ